MQQVFRAIELVADTDSSVLVLGETGTGKELIARAIHRVSRRRPSVMVKVNCGALPATLIESELFGHERGAFTGAVQQKKGRFELAHRGTIFLDEVGELPLEAQVKLLRVLQEQEFERVGGTQTVRVERARDRRHQPRPGRRRAPRHVPRRPVLPAEHLPDRGAAAARPARGHPAAGAALRPRVLRAGWAGRVDRIDPRALERLTSYDWPGNVRELANILERAVILCQGPVLQPTHLALASATPAADDVCTLERPSGGTS